MLAIRMQRTGRKGHAMFRVVVQDSRRTPTSGKLVASLGSYDPHAKTITLNKEKASFYLEHGAQPSERVASLLKAEGIKLPKWVEVSTKKTGKLRNPEKLRRNRPDEPASKAAPEAEVPVVDETEAEATDTVETTAPAEAEVVAETAPVEVEATPETETPATKDEA